MWKIRNGKNQESVVPAVIVLIPGPCAAAIDAAVRLHAFDFLARPAAALCFASVSYFLQLLSGQLSQNLPDRPSPIF